MHGASSGYGGSVGSQLGMKSTSPGANSSSWLGVEFASIGALSANSTGCGITAFRKRRRFPADIRISPGPGR